MNEAALQSIVRRDFAFIGPIWRNNSGACTDATGRLVRYGLGNDSAQINASVKSSDLIAITPVKITADLIGQTLGVFTALEIKSPGWTQRPSDARALAQEKFHDIVRKAGGFAGFVTSPECIGRIIDRAGLK